MANIAVHVLNFHGSVSHITIILEDTSTVPPHYYKINRWGEPKTEWSKDNESKNYARHIRKANSEYKFDIDADPGTIADSWCKYHRETKEESHPLGKNCAVAAQWFLTTFAGVPEPSLANISLDHLAFGIMWPSFIACPVTLPGRITSNAKFHIEQRGNPNAAHDAQLHVRLFVFTSRSLAALVMLPYYALELAIAIINAGISFVKNDHVANKALSSDPDENNHETPKQRVNCNLEKCSKLLQILIMEHNQEQHNAIITELIPLIQNKSDLIDMLRDVEEQEGLTLIRELGPVLVSSMMNNQYELYGVLQLINKEQGDALIKEFQNTQHLTQELNHATAEYFLGLYTDNSGLKRGDYYIAKTIIEDYISKLQLKIKSDHFKSIFKKKELKLAAAIWFKSVLLGEQLYNEKDYDLYKTSFSSGELSKIANTVPCKAMLSKLQAIAIKNTQLELKNELRVVRNLSSSSEPENNEGLNNAG